MKLVIEEEESAALRSRLTLHQTRITSELSLVEVTRAVARARPGALVLAGAVLRSLALLRIDRPVLDLAAGLDPPVLRTLDAIHVASALTVGDVDLVFVAYDRRRLDAAREGGLPVASPA